MKHPARTVEAASQSIAIAWSAIVGAAVVATRPRAVMLGDKGYDSDAIRDEVRARGGTPEIPTKKNRHIQHTVNRVLYATRNRIERFFNRLKNSRRVATRYDQIASSFLGFAKLASIRQWISFVHAT